MTNIKTKPNLSTLRRSATEPDSLFELEKGTQDIVSTIMQRVKDGAEDIKIVGIDKVCPVLNQLMTGVGGSNGRSDACTVATIKEDFYPAAAESSCSEGTDKGVVCRISQRAIRLGAFIVHYNNLHAHYIQIYNFSSNTPLTLPLHIYHLPLYRIIQHEFSFLITTGAAFLTTSSTTVSPF